MSISSTPLNTASYSDILEPLRAHLVPDFFANIELESGSLMFYDTDGNLVFEMTAAYAVRAYRSASSYAESSFASLVFTDITSCKNGAILIAQYQSFTYSIAFLFSKTNNDSTAIMFGNDSGTAHPQAATTTFNRVAWGDAQLSTVQTTVFTPSYGFQTQLVPFCTDATFGSTSFTPNAFYMPMYRNSDVQQTAVDQFVANGATYICYNAWAIKDE